MRFWSWGLLGMSKTALSIWHRDGAHELVDLDVNDVLGALNRRRDPQQPSRGDHQDASGHKGPNSAKQSEHDASLGLVRTPINTGLQSNCTSAQRMAAHTVTHCFCLGRERMLNRKLYPFDLGSSLPIVRRLYRPRPPKTERDR